MDDQTGRCLVMNDESPGMKVTDSKLAELTGL